MKHNLGILILYSILGLNIQFIIIPITVHKSEKKLIKLKLKPDDQIYRLVYRMDSFYLNVFQDLMVF
jgi:hypothetical protein